MVDTTAVCTTSCCIETKNGMKVADIDVVVNRLYHGEFFLIDTRPTYEYALARVVGSLNIPSPANVDDLKRVPSLVWVGLYCVNDEQQAIFNHAISSPNILIGADNEYNTWAKRLYELFDKAQTSSNQTVRFVDITQLQSAAPIMFSPSTQPSWDRCKPASIIIPNVLYLSSLSEAINPKICGTNGYLKPTHIINISNKENSNVFETIGVKYLTIRIDDSESSNISQYFEQTFNFIDECRRKGGKCLLHCQMGISRASTICIYYLMCAKNMTLKDAYHYLKFRRPEIFPNRNFMIQLIEAESRLKGESSVTYSDIGKIGGLLSEYNNTTPAGKESNMMCETCFVM